MAARLGNVLYWTASGIAALLAVFAVLSLGDAVFGTGSTGSAVIWAVMCSVAALLVWLLGRAARYVLAKPDG